MLNICKLASGSFWNLSTYILHFKQKTSLYSTFLGSLQGPLGWLVDYQVFKHKLVSSNQFYTGIVVKLWPFSHLFTIITTIAKYVIFRSKIKQAAQNVQHHSYVICWCLWYGIWEGDLTGSHCTSVSHHHSPPCRFLIYTSFTHNNIVMVYLYRLELNVHHVL